MNPVHVAFDRAISAARAYEGRTSPNPPVGAAALDAEGSILSVQAHPGAGHPHAEALVLRECEEKGLLSRIHTVVVTLEPCAHTGRTPPCADALANALRGPAPGLKRVVYGAEDPNPVVQGRGARLLREAGLEVIAEDLDACHELIRPFSKWIATRIPWITVKTVHRPGLPFSESMVPPPGTKTFSSPSSLKLAHELRRRADAILTGSGTVLSDDPEFTVRHVEDHPPDPTRKKRRLVVLDRRERVPRSWLERAELRGFEVARGTSIEGALRLLGEQGCLEVLVEAGPTLSAAVLSSGLWDRHVVIRVGNSPNEDQIEDVYRNRPENRSSR